MASSNNQWPEIDSSDSEKRRELKISGKPLNDRLEKDATIPKTLFNKLSSLNFLELSESPLLTSIPDDLGGGRLSSSLTNLILRGNRLDRLPSTLGGLKKLKFLDVSRNQLVELPSTIGDCIELQTLNVASNELIGLPSSLIDCVHLAHFDGAHNRFESFPASLIDSKLQHLAEINLKSNRIVDIPVQISELVALKSLDLCENQITIVPGELGDCTKLKDLQLGANALNDRRLRKLIEDGVQKAILDYVRKNCAKSAPIGGKKSGGGGAKGKGKSAAKKAESKKSGSTDEIEAAGDGEEDGGDGIDESKDKIVVTPSRSEVKLIWRKDVAEIRPHLVCCIVKNLDFEDPKVLKQFLVLQTKIHEDQCNRRVAATIATHDLSLIRFPLTYGAKIPEEITIHPLGRPKELSAADLVSKLTAEAEQLRKEKKRQVYSGIHQYLYLVKDKPKYSCLVDSDNRVISFPPITNSDLTKISATTKNILIEVTSDKDLATCKRVMEALLKGVFTSSMIPTDPSSGRKCMSIEQVKVETEDDNSVKTAYPSKIDLSNFGDEIEIIRDWSKEESG